jgi:glycosyltransferase involved in cell wall biosynthesis
MSGRVIVVHPTYRVLGGAERVSLGIVKVLLNESFYVDVLTFNKGLLPKLLCREHNNDSKCSKLAIHEIPVVEGIPSLNKALLQGVVATLALKKLRVDKKRSVVVNTKFNELLASGDVLYMHYPFWTVASQNPRDSSFVLGPALGKPVNPIYYYYLKMIGNFYSRISLELIERAKRVLFNSVYTYTLFTYYNKHNVLVESSKGKLMVLNPPIDERFFKSNIHDKENLLVLRLKGVRPDIASEIISKLSSALRSWKVVVIGYAGQDYEKLIKSKLANLDNISMAFNIDESEKVRLLAKARIYIHPMMYEHFGILIGEALASGCRVVVHKFTGIVHDLLHKHPWQTVGKCIKVYNSHGEIPELVFELLQEDVEPEICRRLVMDFRGGAAYELELFGLGGEL